MAWEKTANREWTAKGKFGAFIITQTGKSFWGKYVSNNGLKSFKMRPALKLSEAKAQCESNYYWEDKKQ